MLQSETPGARVLPGLIEVRSIQRRSLVGSVGRCSRPLVVAASPVVVRLPAGHDAQMRSKTLSSPLGEDLALGLMEEKYVAPADHARVLHDPGGPVCRKPNLLDVVGVSGGGTVMARLAPQLAKVEPFAGLQRMPGLPRDRLRGPLKHNLRRCRPGIGRVLRRLRWRARRT